jgi:uncharacterized protein (TIGR03437 family)
MIQSRVGRAILAMVPSVVLLHAYSNGPDPRVTGAPGDNQLACAACHNTSPLNSGGGNVKINFATGQTYTPGAAQTFSIVITDAVARIYGFQMTARLESNLANGQAGDFTAGAGQMVLCDNNNLKGDHSVCPANAPVQFIEHNGDPPFRTNTISVQWTAPATNVGNVHLYIAANAANGDANFTGDHIYTADYVLTPQGSSGGGATPSITLVSCASAFNPNAGLTSGTWLEIYGAGLSTTTRSWAGGDFKGSNAPTSVDGVSVTVNGIPAYVAYVSPGQINVQAPDDSSIGDGMQIQVTNASGKSNTMSITKKALAPALLAPGVFIVDGKQYVVAQFQDQTYVGRTGLIAGLSFRPAKPGEVITIYGIGCGPVTPATLAGTIAAGLTALQNPPAFRFGNTTATVPYAGLVAGLVGLYQFNVVVPNVPPGDVALAVDIGGVSANPGLFITVGQ